MYGHPFNWPRQNWRVNPEPAASVNLRPISMNSNAFLRRDQVVMMTAAANQTDNDKQQTSSSTFTCHANLDGSDGSHADLDYDNLYFEDMFGNAVDGRTCDVIYGDEEEKYTKRDNQPLGIKGHLFRDCPTSTSYPICELPTLVRMTCIYCGSVCQ